MKLPAIITTDLHLTANPADSYRWGLFPWLAEEAKKHRARTIAILGDLTDAKDYHSSVLVNRVVDNINMLRQVVPHVDILEGNHDYLKDGNPFFSFLNKLPGVRFISSMVSDDQDELPCLWLPHSKNPAKDWPDIKSLDWYSHIFMHQTFNGSIASNGQEMTGEGVEKLDWFHAGMVPEIWSGDIHVPQKLGLVEYVGSPYHVHFGDKFKPRVILLDRGNKRRDLHFETISRVSLKVSSRDQLQSLCMNPGDQLKLKVILQQSEQHDWPKWRSLVETWARRHEVELCGLTLEVEKSRRRLDRDEVKKVRSPDAVVLDYVTAEDLGPEAYEAAMDILES